MQRRSAGIQLRRATVAEIHQATQVNSDSDNDEDDYADTDDTFDEATDSEDDHFSEYEDNSEANSLDEDEEMGADQPALGPEFYYGRDQTEWRSYPYDAPISQRFPHTQYNKVIATPGHHFDSNLDCFRILFNGPVIDIVVRYTNIEAQKHNASWKVTDRMEILAFCGLLLAAGVDRSSKRCYKEFFGRLRGMPLFKACMSKRRFSHLLRMIRFDDRDTRSVRRARDKLAPIRDLFDLFVKNLKKSYLPGPNVTVDEQLVPFYGRCAFKQYIPSKPDKYGLKIFWVCDSKTWYPLNASVYLGRERSGSARRVNIAYDIVKELCEPYYRTNRNVTFDNFFTSYELAQDLRMHGLTCVGTVRKNKAFIPPQFQANRRREVNSNLFGYRKIATLVSHVPRKNKIVNFLSTLHHNGEVNEEGKSNINLFYNETKSGVDVLDMLCHTYSAQRKTKRWPFAFFMNLLNVAGIAAFVIYRNVNGLEGTAVKTQRKRFLMTLCEELTYDHIKRRSLIGLDTSNRETIASVLHVPLNEPSTSSQLPRPRTKKRCFLCPTKNDCKVKQMCDICKKNVCNKHSSVLRKCQRCAKKPHVNTSDSE